MMQDSDKQIERFLTANIREAEMDDIPALVRLGKRMHEESPRYCKMGYVPMKLAALAEYLIESDEGILVVGQIGDDIVGFMAGIVTEQFFSNERYASEMALYVVPEARRGALAAGLVADFLLHAKEAGAEETIVGTTTGVMQAQTVTMYEGMGFNAIGTVLNRGMEDVSRCQSTDAA